jgi:hypothetical protein
MRHYAFVAGHLGFSKACERLTQDITWLEMYSKLKNSQILRFMSKK